MGTELPLGNGVVFTYPEQGRDCVWVRRGSEGAPTTSDGGRSVNSTRQTRLLPVVSHVDTVPDTGHRIVGGRDCDLDGKVDLLRHHATRGEVWVWPMNGANRLSQDWVGTVPDVGYQIVR